MTEQTSALKSKENNNAAGNQTKQAKRRKPQNQMQQSHGKPPSRLRGVDGIAGRGEPSPLG